MLPEDFFVLFPKFFHDFGPQNETFCWFLKKNAQKVKKVAKKFGGKEKMSTFAIPNEKNGKMRK